MARRPRKVLWADEGQRSERLSREEAARLASEAFAALSNSETAKGLTLQLARTLADIFRGLDDRRFKYAVAVASSLIRAALRYYAYASYKSAERG